MTVFAAQGDPRRTMELLWGVAEHRPARKRGLNADVIVDAGIAIADAHGMDAVSMRAVGERLGCTAMALYTHVPGKNELVDLMYDRVLAEIPGGYDLGAGWRAAVHAWARDQWNFCLRHPWALRVSQARPVLGPNEFAVLNTLVGILRETGLGPRDLRPVVHALGNHVRGSAATVAEAREAPAATGMSEDDWWLARGEEFASVAPDFAERFPLVVWIESDRDPMPEDAGYMEYHAEEAFVTGIDLLLDGVETHVVS
ncbi:TetR family transcriptional regulator [Herbihabitans rhizosphaerae]|uniref:TetR family transcriptional regulator n=1 Tax=Herbihabitans rhizosphaerae TaxID=1872711 RepID=A0A4Q7KDH6_9PSEU|nr:TetR/AcrR family transcriptional regulator [Herbihabitans rhizosphaerae]RZS31237.1 TetR family transcriptional regulator [Herbihabitans rhizosphaerae]